MLGSKNRRFLTDYLQILNFIFTIFSCFILDVVVFRESYIYQLNAFFFAIIIIVGPIVYYYSKRFYPEHTRPFGLITLCGVVARITLFFLQDTPGLLQFLCFFTFNCTSFFLYLPVRSAERHFSSGKNKNLVRITSIFLLLLLFGLTALMAWWKPENLTEILTYQTYYTLFIGSSIDLCVPFWDGVKCPRWRIVEPEVIVVHVRSNSEPRRCTETPPRLTPTTPPVEASSSTRSVTAKSPSAPPEEVLVLEPSSDPNSAPECKICFEPYSEHKIPRILTTCGHSMCQDCAQQSMRSQNHVECPYCRKVTETNGTIESLPRNYALLEMIS